MNNGNHVHRDPGGNDSHFGSEPATDKRESERAELKKQADSLRESANRQELIQSIRSILQSVQSEFDARRFENILENGSSKEIKNALLEIHRTIELERKTNRVSAKTIHYSQAFQKVAEKTAQDKLMVERIRSHLERFQSPDKRNALTSDEKIEVRKLVYSLRHGLETFKKTQGDALKLFHLSVQGRSKDIGEEKTLHHSIKYYLQFVDAPQRAHIETMMKDKMKDLPFDQRLSALKAFVANLVQASPGIMQAEADRLYEIALHFIGENQIDDAIAELKNASGYAKEDAKIYVLLARCWRLKNDRVQEIQQLERALEYDPENIEYLLTLANVYEENHEPFSAIRTYRKVLEFRPANLKLLTHLTKISFDCEAWPVCIPFLQQLLELKPRSLKTQKRLGIAAVRSGDYAQGISILKNVLRQENSDPQVYLNLGIAYRAQALFADAFAAFETAAKMSHKDREIVYWLAAAYYDRGDYEKTESLCCSLFGQDKPEMEVNLLLSKALRRTGKSYQAIELLQAMIDDGITRKDVLVEYGNACLKSKREEKAYKVFKKAIEILPGDEDIRHVFGLACIQTGRIQESIAFLTPATS